MTFIDLKEVKKMSYPQRLLGFKMFYFKKKSPEPWKSLKIFGIIYLLFLNIPFWGVGQKCPICILKKKDTESILFYRTFGTLPTIFTLKIINSNNNLILIMFYIFSTTTKTSV